MSTTRTAFPGRTTPEAVSPAADARLKRRYFLFPVKFLENRHQDMVKNSTGISNPTTHTDKLSTKQEERQENEGGGKIKWLTVFPHGNYPRIFGFQARGRPLAVQIPTD